ncbi:MAG: hypothetical protein WC639_05000 [Patescibacteria group bacterium]|jgi:hypothetical protein
MKEKKNQNKNSINSIVVGFPVIAQGLEALGYTTNKFSFVASAVCALISIWGNFANKKVSDFMLQFEEHKDDLVMSVVQSDKFISVFLELFDRNIKESNEEKRQLLKNYILNMAIGIEQDFNEHTKLINVLNNITADELIILKMWGEGGIISNNTRYKNIGRITVNEIRNCVLDTRSVKNNNKLGAEEDYIYNLSKVKDKLNQILLSLGYKDLLYVLSENNFGSGEEARVKNITNFGKSFLNFIRK